MSIPPHTVDELYIHSACHLNSPTWAVYRPNADELEIICAECKKHITTFNLEKHGDTSTTTRE